MLVGQNVLAPLGAPVRMIEGGALRFGVVMSEVNNELIGAGRERLEDFFVGVEPLRLRNTGGNTEKLIEYDGVVVNEGRKIGRLLPVAADEQGRESVSFGGGEIGLGEVGGADDGAHVGIDVRNVDAGGEGFVDLSVSFREDIGHFGASGDIFSEKREVAVGVEQARIFRLRGDGGPTVTGPIGVQGEMDAEIGVGVGLGPLRDFREPRTGDENAGGSNPMVLESFFGSHVDRMHHAEVVGMDDEQARIDGIAEALSERIGSGGSGLLSEERNDGENKDGKDKAGEAAKHESSEGATEGIMDEWGGRKREDLNCANGKAEMLIDRGEWQ
jgi:hypothetical protein